MFEEEYYVYLLTREESAPHVIFDYEPDLAGQINPDDRRGLSQGYMINCC